MVIGQLAITCIYYGFVGLARCMEHLNNSQHIPYIQGSRLQRRWAGVPRCQRTLENDVQNRGKHIDGWAFDPNWVKEGLQMASLVEIKRNIFE